MQDPGPSGFWGSPRRSVLSSVPLPHAVSQLTLNWVDRGEGGHTGWDICKGQRCWAHSSELKRWCFQRSPLHLHPMGMGPSCCHLGADGDRGLCPLPAILPRFSCVHSSEEPHRIPGTPPGVTHVPNLGPCPILWVLSQVGGRWLRRGPVCLCHTLPLATPATVDSFQMPTPFSLPAP